MTRKGASLCLLLVLCVSLVAAVCRIDVLDNAQRWILANGAIRGYPYTNLGMAALALGFDPQSFNADLLIGNSTKITQQDMLPGDLLISKSDWPVGDVVVFAGFYQKSDLSSLFVIGIPYSGAKAQAFVVPFPYYDTTGVYVPYRPIGIEDCNIDTSFSYFTPTNPCPYGTLSYTNPTTRAPAVTVLQYTLQGWGIDVDNTGQYDVSTRQAVNTFQGRGRMRVTGTVDNYTWSVLYYPYQFFSSDARVGGIQSALNLQNNAQLDVNNNFDVETRQAIINWKLRFPTIFPYVTGEVSRALLQTLASGVCATYYNANITYNQLLQSDASTLFSNYLIFAPMIALAVLL